MNKYCDYLNVICYDYDRDCYNCCIMCYHKHGKCIDHDCAAYDRKEERR